MKSLANAKMPSLKDKLLAKEEPTIAGKAVAKVKKIIKRAK